MNFTRSQSDASSTQTQNQNQKFTTNWKQSVRVRPRKFAKFSKNPKSISEWISLSPKATLRRTFAFGDLTTKTPQTSRCGWQRRFVDSDEADDARAAGHPHWRSSTRHLMISMHGAFFVGTCINKFVSHSPPATFCNMTAAARPSAETAAKLAHHGPSGSYVSRKSIRLKEPDVQF